MERPNRFQDELCRAVPTDAGWKKLFSEIFVHADTGEAVNENAARLLSFLREEYETQTVYPTTEHLFRAFRECPMTDVRAVILGQDPYHEPGQAEGLSFSVPTGTPLPPSLKNIFKERETDLGIPAAGADGCLLPWARQGVLLLNTVLTVRRGEAGSHRKRGWEAFTDAVIRALDELPQPLVFVLWGRDARGKKSLLHNPAHLILESEHPSPLSAYRGFFGSAPFSKINRYLTERDLPEIDFST